MTGGSSISGGTLKLAGEDTEIGIPAKQAANTYYPDGKGLTITGGTIFKESGGQARIGGSLPSNASGTNVYYTKVNVLDTYGSDSHIEDASITEISYGLDDVKTDGDGILHMYLPANTGSNATYARFADDYYKGIVTSTEAKNELTKLISLAGATVTLTLPVGGYIYDGTEKNPSITVSLGENTVNPADYDVSYFNTNGGAGNHTNAGTVNVTVTGKNNYVASASKSFEIAKADQSNLSITAVNGKKYGDPQFTLETTGGTGNGQVSYSLPTDNGVLSISGSVATIIGVGTVTVTASKAGEGGNYNSITATREINITKTPAPTITFPTASNISYGQKISESSWIGGDVHLGDFEWTDDSIVPDVGSNQYEVIFTPNTDAVNNYEDMTSKNQNVAITVDKASPTVTVESTVSGDADNRQAVLVATIDGVSNGDVPTGSVTFVNSTSGTDASIATNIIIENGRASHTWTGLEDAIYKIKAIYNGDSNYNKAESQELSFDTKKQRQENFSLVDIGNKTYGESSFKLSSIGGSGTGLVTFKSSNPDVLSIEGDIANIHKAGNVEIIATKMEDKDYNKANASISLTIDKKPLSLKADNQLNVIRGTSIPNLTYSSTGLVGGDSFTTEPRVKVIDGDINKVGEYLIIISGGILDNTDSYAITYINGKLSVVEALYPVTVTSGSGTGSYSQGHTVAIVANKLRGYTFTGWTSTQGVEFEDKSARTTTFTMPNQPINITANYKKNSSGDSTGGGSSSGGGSKDQDTTKDKDTTQVEITKKPDMPTKVTASTSSTVKEDTANVQVSKNIVKEAIEKAQAAGEKNATEEDGISVEIKVDTKNVKASNLSANIGQSTIKDLTKAGVRNLSINSDVALISLDLETLKTIQDAIKTDINISAKKVEKTTLPAEVQEIVGNRPVFDFSITGSNGEKLTKFGKGKISIAIPYTLAPGEKPENLFIYYINEEGGVEEMPNSLYDAATGTISFETDHFSKFAVGYKKDAVVFTDIENHWAKGDIDFVTARKLFAGTGDNKFSPDMSMTRGMFVTVLGRLAQADTNNYKESSFKDVKSDAYYMPYTEWARQNNIVNGISATEFAPEQSITREQMAVIMVNYSKSTEFKLPKVKAENIFTDSEQISRYAKVAVKQMQMAGIISGKDNNKFEPQGTATRAEVSAILKRFIGVVEK